MPNIYCIRDPKVKADTLVFLSESDGSASSYFYNYSMVIKRNDLTLMQLGGIEFADSDGMYQLMDLRHEVCRMPEPLEDET